MTNLQNKLSSLMHENIRQIGTNSTQNRLSSLMGFQRNEIRCFFNVFSSHECSKFEHNLAIIFLPNTHCLSSIRSVNRNTFFMRRAGTDFRIFVSSTSKKKPFTRPISRKVRRILISACTSLKKGGPGCVKKYWI